MIVTPGHIYLHKKSGRRYRVLHVGLLEKTLEVHVVYTRDIIPVDGQPSFTFSTTDWIGTVWIRPLDEFVDGRFVEV